MVMRGWVRFMTAVLLICVSAGVFAGCQLLPKEEEALPPPALEPQEIVYNTYEVKRGDIVDMVSGTGKFVSSATEDLFFVNSGRVGTVYVRYGQQVVAGDPLVSLDVGSLEQTKTIQYYYLRQANIRLAALREQEGASKYDIQLAEYDVKIARLNYDTTAAVLENATLLAPFDGMVSSITNLKPGDYVDAYINLVQVVDPSQVLVVMDDSVANNFKLGQEVFCTFDGQELTGTVVQGIDDKSTVDDDGTGLANHSIVQFNDFTPATNVFNKQVTVRFIRQSKTGVIVVPRRVLTKSMGRDIVYLLVDGEKMEAAVEIGITTTSEAEIISGLNEGDKIILS